ncbi:hypothetical protein STAS_22352 [Striga asiatica]|uniref:Uncharacterized protein n=1 Tax=Striga asiatica TaxID=4170 RepID=A0A5A7QJ73_STRAF|nr:hypothetical protein STAS_22352 [Striga asiatica]
MLPKPSGINKTTEELSSKSDKDSICPHISSTFQTKFLYKLHISPQFSSSSITIQSFSHYAIKRQTYQNPNSKSKKYGKMKAVVDKKNEKATIRAECRADEGRKHLEKVELKTRDADTVKYVEKKLADKGVGRLDRHPADGLPLKHDPKKGHGGKYTWEGPAEEYEAELGAEPALDKGDPNYVEEEEEEGKEEAAAAAELVVGEVEVAKAAGEGVARIEVDPQLKVD